MVASLSVDQLRFPFWGTLLTAWRIGKITDTIADRATKESAILSMRQGSVSPTMEHDKPTPSDGQSR